MTVIETVRFYHLELANKEYKDVYGKKHNLVNLDKLCDLEVKDFYLNIKTNEAIITVIGIENI